MSLFDRLRSLLSGSRKSGGAVVDVMLPRFPSSNGASQSCPPHEGSLIPGDWHQDQDTKNEQFLRSFKIALGLVMDRAGEGYNPIYSHASELAWRGKDPRKILDQLRHPGTDITTILSDAPLPPSAKEFVDMVLFETAVLMDERLHYTRDTIMTIYATLTSDQQTRLTDTMRTTFEQFIQRRYSRSPKRENEILRRYDARRNEDNIPAILRRAQTNARAGDVNKTVDILAQVEQKACGDWAPEMFDTLRAAYQANVDYMVQKAERAFAKHKPRRGMHYLERAEHYAQAIGLPLQAQRPETVKDYFHLKAFAAYEEAWANSPPSPAQ